MVKQEFLRSQVEAIPAESVQEDEETIGISENTGDESDNMDTSSTAEEPVADFNDYAETCQEEQGIPSEEVSLFFKSILLVTPLQMLTEFIGLNVKKGENTDNFMSMPKQTVRYGTS